MKNKLKILLLITLSVFLLSSCYNKSDDIPKEDTTKTKVTKKGDQKIENKEIDKKSLLDEIKLVNDKIRKVYIESDFRDQRLDVVDTEKFVADVLYDNNKKVSKVKTSLETSKGYMQEITFDLSKSNIGTVLEKNAREEETKVSEVKVEGFDLRPDYHRLIKYITDINNDYRITEDSNSYILELDYDTKEISDYIIDEYVEKFTEVKDNDIKKYVKIEIDKNTKLLKSFYLELLPSTEGLEGYKVNAKSKFSDHELAD